MGVLTCCAGSIRGDSVKQLLCVCVEWGAMGVQCVCSSVVWLCVCVVWAVLSGAAVVCVCVC